MTDNQAQIIKEIKLYQERMGRWPSISSLAYIMKVTQPTMTSNIKTMARRGYVEYVEGWTKGQTRQVKTCDL